ncbi:MAG: hypothetical protein ABII26_03065, partial [Pseudomonadota bacterium]
MHLNLEKGSSGWFITKYTWNLIDTNHPKYDRSYWQKAKKKLLPEKLVNHTNHPAQRGPESGWYTHEPPKSFYIKRMEDYPPKSLDEKNIIATVLEFQNANNAYDW